VYVFNETNLCVLLNDASCILNTWNMYVVSTIPKTTVKPLRLL
jgi:hypothetical protein